MDTRKEFVMSRMAAIDTGRRALGVLAAAAILAACGELPQDGPKPFVQDGTYGGQAAAHTPGLAERARFQDEYVLLETEPAIALAEGAAK
jgi:hypothetical protein